LTSRTGIALLALALGGQCGECSHAQAAEDCAAVYTAEALRTTHLDALRTQPLPAGASFRAASVAIVRQDVFNLSDPKENNALSRLANAWHLNTREHVIRTLLLFDGGEPVTAQVLAESERLLRSRSFFADARVIVNRRCADAVDVAVVTRDVWSLLPSLGATRTGGRQEFEIGVSDINVAGRGAALEVELFRNLDRDGLSVGFSDENLGNSRTALHLRFEDTDDGESALARIGQPFYALDARRAWGASASDSALTGRRYQAGKTVASYAARARRVEAWAGWSAGLKGGFASRFSAGITFEEQRIEPISGVWRSLRDHDFAYPWLAFERIEDEYAKTRNLDHVQSTEDVFLGQRLTASLGYSPRGDGYAAWSATFRNGARLRDDDILLYGADASGYWNTRRRRGENTAGRAWARYRRRHTERLALHVEAEATLADQLTAERQVLLGGDTGLRGYPNRFQAGTRRFRITVEERLYTDLYLLRILRVAAAAFLDTGRAWGGERDNDMLANAGLGLRLKSTRTDRSLVYHVDLAFPLADAPGARGTELTLTGKRGF
jgi:hypothetical protein